jgi:hypothetical protein
MLSRIRLPILSLVLEVELLLMWLPHRLLHLLQRHLLKSLRQRLLKNPRSHLLNSLFRHPFLRKHQ